MNSDVPNRRTVEINAPHLPIACPNERTPPELLHPRVWLAPTKGDTCMCPYCGTIYRLRSGLAATKKPENAS